MEAGLVKNSRAELSLSIFAWVGSRDESGQLTFPDGLFGRSTAPGGRRGERGRFGEQPPRAGTVEEAAAAKKLFLILPLPGFEAGASFPSVGSSPGVLF